MGKRLAKIGQPFFSPKSQRSQFSRREIIAHDFWDFWDLGLGTFRKTALYSRKPSCRKRTSIFI